MAKDVGERYARALLEVTEERKETAAVAEALDSLAHAIATSPELEQVMRDPRMKTERVNVFSALAVKIKAPTAVVSIVRTLDEAERLDEIGNVATAFRRLADEKAGRIRAEVTSAAALSEPEKTAMQKALSEAVGKAVTLSYQTDTALIGGVVVKLQDLVWDGSVKSQLERMRQALRT